MEIIKRIIRVEPILVSRLIGSAAAVLIAFGVPIENSSVEAAVEATAALFGVLNLVMAALERQSVYSPATHNREVAEAEQRVGAETI